MLDRFRSAGTQVLGVSVDSVYSHANWAKSMNGISYPLLSDFEPKGGLAQALGLYLEGPGITDRATVIVDRQGKVQYANSAGPGGKRDMAELAAECEKVESGAGLAGPANLPSGSKLFVKNQCGASRAALLAVDNLHQRDHLNIINVSGNGEGMAELKSLGGKDQAPCLWMNGKAMYESGDIVQAMVNCVAPV